MTDRTYNKHHQLELLKHYSHYTSPHITHHSVNDEYNYLMNAVEECLAVGVSKHVKIRLSAWIDKL